MQSTSRMPGLVLAAMASALLLVYMLTMAPGYTFEDTAQLTAACASLGVAHPPGYPLWVLACSPFEWAGQQLGFNPGKGAALFSAAAMAAACVMLARLCMSVFGNAAVAFTVAAACGLSLTAWSQAIIQEVYALNLALFLACMLLADAYARDGGKPRLYALALLGGLGLANHWPLFLINAPVIALWLLPAWQRLRCDLRSGTALLACVAALAVGLLPYAHLLTFDPDSSQFVPGALPDSFWDYVRREHFSQFDALSQHPRIDQRVSDGGLALVSLLRQYSWLGGALGVAGLLVILKRLHPVRGAALAWGLLGSTFALAVYRPYLSESDLSNQIFSNYGLVAYALFALPIAALLVAACRAWRVPATPQWLFALALVAGLLAWNKPQVDRSADNLAMTHARLVNGSLPANAKLLVGNNGWSSFAMQYFDWLEPDLSGHLDTQVAVLYLGEERSVQDLPRLLARETVPVALGPFVEARFAGVVWHGSHYSYVPGSGQGALELDAAAREFLLYVADLRDRTNSPWSRRFADRLLFETARTAHVTLRGGGQLDPADAQLLDQLEGSVAVRFANFLDMAANSSDEPLAVIEMVDSLGDLRQYPLEWRTDIKHILGSAWVRAGNIQQAILVLEDALAGFRAATNARVLTDLLALHAQAGNFKRYSYLRRRYPALDAVGLEGFDRRCAANLNQSCVK